jgi:hypothetical protein
MRNVVTIVAILLLLGIGGFLYMNIRTKTPAKPVPQVKKVAENVTSNAFTSIQEALSKSLSLKCDYKDDKGVEYITYIKAGSVRVMPPTTSTGMNNILMIGKKMYMWDDKTKTGFTYSLDAAKITPVAKTSPSQMMASSSAQTEDKKESLMSQIEKYKDYCKPSVVEASLFVVPKDIVFQDFSELTNKMMKGIPQDYLNK